MTASPRSLFDILSYISVEQLLTYIDEQNTHPNEHIGLMDIFGHDRQKFEKEVVRPIIAMFKMGEDDLLINLPEINKVWLNSLSRIERIRFGIYSYLKEHGAVSKLLLGGSVLIVLAVYGLMRMALSRKRISGAVQPAVGAGASGSGASETASVVSDVDHSSPTKSP